MCRAWTEFMCLIRVSSGSCMDKLMDCRVSEKAA